MVAIEAADVQNAWGILEPFISKAVDGMDGGHTVATLLQTVIAQEIDLWVAVRNGAVIALVGTDIETEPSGQRICNVRFCVGRHISKWVHLIGDLEAYARLNRCVKIATWARKGWTKALPDYKLTHVLLEKSLD